MNTAFLPPALYAAQLVVALAMLLALWRLLIGPRAQDRVLALDSLYVDAMLILLIHGIRTTSSVYFETSLLIGVLGFISTFALSKFLLRGEVIE